LIFHPGTMDERIFVNRSKPGVTSQFRVHLEKGGRSFGSQVNWL
jgi:hypothetical protein